MPWDCANPHLEPVLRSPGRQELGAVLEEARRHLGYPAWVAATALMLVGIRNIVGIYFCGYFGQRYTKKDVLSLLFLARAVIFVMILIVPVSETSILIFGAALGFLWLGAVPLTTGVIASIFGPVYLSTLFGTVFLSHQLVGFLGAWLAGHIYDTFQSYDIMWWMSVALGLAAAALHWPIREEPLRRPLPPAA